MNFKAVIFDMDGLLIDSELYLVKADLDFLEKYNIKLTPEHVAKMMGKSLNEWVSIIKDEFKIPLTTEELLGSQNIIGDKIYNYQAQVMKGAEDLLKKIKMAKLQTAIASGSALKRIKTIVDRFGWNNYFDQLISCDQVGSIGKPNPAIYTYTAQVLDVAPTECVVFEDSINGVRAAKQAGMCCVAVPDPRWSYGDFSDADVIVDSLEDIKLFKFLGLKELVTY